MGRARYKPVKDVQKRLAEKKVAPGLASWTTTPTSGGYGGIGRKGKDIMLRSEKELASDLQTSHHCPDATWLGQT